MSAPSSSPHPAPCWSERIAALSWPPADAPPRLLGETPDALHVRLGRSPDPTIDEALLRCLLEAACVSAAPAPGLCLHWSDALQAFVGVVDTRENRPDAAQASHGLRALAQHWLRLTAQAEALASPADGERP